MEAIYFRWRYLIGTSRFPFGAGAVSNSVSSFTAIGDHYSAPVLPLVNSLQAAPLTLPEKFLPWRLGVELDGRIAWPSSL